MAARIHDRQDGRNAGRAASGKCSLVLLPILAVWVWLGGHGIAWLGQVIA